MKLLDIQNIYVGLAALDKYDTIIEGRDGEKVIVPRPYQFSGKAAWNMAKNKMLLKPLIDVLNETRNRLIRQISGGKDSIDESNSEQMNKFKSEMEQILAKEEEVKGLLKIRIDEFKLDENPISPSVLEALSPIIQE